MRTTPGRRPVPPFRRARPWRRVRLLFALISIPLHFGFDGNKFQTLREGSHRPPRGAIQSRRICCLTSCVENRAGPPVAGPSAGCEALPAGVSKVSQGRSKEQQTAPWRHKAFQQR